MLFWTSLFSLQLQGNENNLSYNYLYLLQCPNPLIKRSSFSLSLRACSMVIRADGAWVGSIVGSQIVPLHFSRYYHSESNVFLEKHSLWINFFSEIISLGLLYIFFKPLSVRKCVFLTTHYLRMQYFLRYLLQMQHPCISYWKIGSM